MNKAELLSLANKGNVEINGIPLEVIVRPAADGEPWLDINVEPLSPLHQPLNLGGKWVEYITDEECEELPEALVKYKKEAEEFCKKAESVVKAKLNPDGSFSFESPLPDFYKEALKEYPSLLKRVEKERHPIVFIGDEKEYWRAPGKFTLELNGVQYKPHWSYWLDCSYYIADALIKKIGG